MREIAVGSFASLAALLILSPAHASASERVLRGDAVRGGQLFRLECGSCHGADGKGNENWRKAIADKKELGTLPDLTDNAFLAQRSDDELREAIRNGKGRGRNIPAHSFRNFSILETWDLVEWIRQDTLRVDDFFPGAAKFTAKDFRIDGHGAERLASALKTQVPEEELEVVVLTIYSGKREKNEEPKLIPWTPVDLDLLSAKDRLGFLSFVDLKVPRSGETIRVGLAIGLDGKLRQIKVHEKDPAKRSNYEKALASFVGQGSKGASSYPAPKNLKDGALWASALSRSASLAAEGITMFEKAERARTAFDR